MKLRKQLSNPRFYLSRSFVVGLSALTLFVAQQSAFSAPSHKETIADVKASEDIQMTEASLDAVFNKRDDEQVQKKLLAFIQTKPALPQEYAVAWKIARLASFVGNFGEGLALPKSQRKAIFEYGVEAGQLAVKLNDKAVEGHYWYGINSASLAKISSIFSALSIIKKARSELENAEKIDAKYHFYGAYRVLGRIFKEVPSYSFGDKKIAEDYYKKAIESAPKYRLNYIYYAKLLAEEGKKQDALNNLKIAKELPDMDGKTEELRFKKEIEEIEKEL